MDHLVLSHILLSGETFTALVASIWFLSCMYACVNFKMISSIEYLSTAGARIETTFAFKTSFIVLYI